MRVVCKNSLGNGDGWGVYVCVDLERIVSIKK